MTPDPTLTDEELAEIEKDCDRALAINEPVGTSFVVIARYVPRLIAALRASRDEIEGLRSEVAVLRQSEAERLRQERIAVYYRQVR